MQKMSFRIHLFSITHGKTDEIGKGSAGAEDAHRQAQRGEVPYFVIKPVAGAAAQRPVCGGGKTARLPVARGVQTDSAGRKIPFSRPQQGDCRFGLRAGRLVAGGGSEA